jgi:hypothetical protein
VNDSCPHDHDIKKKIYGGVKKGENNAVYETYRIHISCCTAFNVVITLS